MCGLAGMVSENSRYISAERIGAAIKCLRHRGSANDAVWMNDENTVALAHLRLPVIDLSKEAAQPMQYLNRYCIIHNGELYNYLEIKKTLQTKGYQFKTQSDTEVIVAAYDCFGQNCLHQFDGMFAFAVWDEKEKKLFAARDRFGEKPFFFFYDEEQLLFGSEIKLLWSLGVKKEVNNAMLYNFLTIGYTTNPTDAKETFFRNIHKLPAACFLTFSPVTTELQIENYWQVYLSVKNISEQEAIENFQHLFSESIRKRLRSDVHIGTSLSGGLDSSSIVAFSARQFTEQFTHKCFTAAFKNSTKDELKYAEAVATQFQLKQYTTGINENDLPALMSKVSHQQDEPFGSASVLAQYKVFELAKQNDVTVVLDGQGADEILAGYHKYYKWYWQELYKNKQLAQSKEIKAAAALGIQEPFGWKNKLAALYPDFVFGILQTKKARQAFHHPDLTRDFAFSNKQNLYYSLPTQYDLNGVLFFNTFVNGLEELLRFADRNSMAHTVEVRLPFLNHELVEFLFSLPPHLKIHNGWTKWLLRKSVDNLLPREITWRKDKLGFEPPQKKWMENKNVQEAIHEGKKTLAAHHILQPSAIRKKIQPHDSYAAYGMDWKYWSASFLF